MGEVSGQLSGVEARARSVSSSLAALGSKLTLGVTVPAVALGGAAIKTAADIDALRLGLVAVTGSADAAKKQFDQLREVAKLPGLGFKEAVQGSVNLQALGFSADQSQQILKAFGNALATVGRGREDLNEVIRQLGQLGSRGKVTADNLRPIIERVPQVAAIIKREFGGDALGDPAKTFDRLGVSSQQFIDVLVRELGKLPQVGTSAKNAIENFRESIELTTARIGDRLLPAVVSLLPKLESLVNVVADGVDGFTKLPPQIQNTAVTMGALVIAAGPVISIIEKLSGALIAIRGAAGVASVGLAGLFGAAIVVGVGQTLTAIDQLRDRYKALEEDRKRAISGATDDNGFGPARESLRGMKIDVSAVAKEFQLFGGETETAAKKTDTLKGSVEKAAVELRKYAAIKLPTLDLILLQERFTAVLSEQAQRVSAAAALLREYNSVTLDGAIAAARRADEQFRLNRALDEAPDIGGFRIGLDQIPKAPTPNLPGPDQFEEFKKLGVNIGELGMQTKEQYDAMARAAKTSSKFQQEAIRQVSTVLTDLSRGITDVIFRGGKIGDMFKGVAQQAAQSITRLLIEGALSKLATKILDVGGLFGKVFGGGVSAASSAVGGAASAASGAGSGAVGSAVGAVSSGITGVISAVTGVVSAVSGIVGNFQFAAMNKTLDLIEKEVRFSQIHLGYILEKQNEYLPKLADIHQRLIEFRQLGIKLEAGGSYEGALAGGGGVQINMAGAYILSDSQMADFADRLARYLKTRGL